MAKRGPNSPPRAKKNEDKPFDPNEFAREAERSGVAIREKLVSMGVTEEDIPHALEKIDESLGSIRELSKKYAELVAEFGDKFDAKKKLDLETHIRRLGVTLSNRIGKTEKSATELAETKKQLASAPTGLAPELLHAVEKNEATKRAEIASWGAVPAPATEASNAEPKTEFLNQEEVDALLAGVDLSTPNQAETDADVQPEVVSAETNPLQTEPSQPGKKPNVYRSNRKNTHNAEVVLDPDDARNPDKPTAGESRSMLRELVGKLVEKTKEKFDWYKSSKENLIRRNKELDAEAENVKGFEKMFRKLGENYNKMGWKSKLIIGAGLGLGAGLSGAAVSGVGILGFTTLIVAQRTAALATMYLKYEKKASPDGEERGNDVSWWHIGAKEKAFLKAALYTAAMTAGTAEAVKEIRESSLAQNVNEWLGNTMEKVADKFSGTTYHPEAGAIATAPSVLPEKIQIQSDNAPLEQTVSAPQSAPTPEVPQPAAAGEPVPRPISTKSFPSPEAPARFEMPKHADFSIHEDDTTISPYDVTPTDQSGTDDDIVQVSEEPQPVAEPEEQVQTETPIEADEPSAEPIEAVPEAEAPAEPLPNVKVPESPQYVKVDLTQEQASAETPSTSAETPNVKSLIARLETSPSPAEAHSILDAIFSSPHNVSPDTVSAAIKAASHMNVDPSLVNYIEPNTGEIPGPAVFLGQDGGLTVYGAASVGDTYTVQRTVAERFAALSGQSVKVLLPNGVAGYELVHPSGLVSVETPSFWNFSFKPPLPVTQSVYVFQR